MTEDRAQAPAGSAAGRETGSGAMATLAFGAIFLSGGLLVVFFIFAREFSLHRRSASWARVPATIRKVQLEEVPGRRMKSFRVVAEYDYEFGGSRHVGTRVGVEDSASADARHRERHQALARHRQSGAPFIAWVNPQDPRESLLFREMTVTTWAILPMGLLGIVVGLAAVAEGVRSRAAYTRSRSRLAADPGRPWRADPRWEAGFAFPSKERDKLLAAWGVLAFLGVYAISFGCIALTQDTDPYIKAAALALAAATTGCLIYALLRTARYRRYGRPVLALARVPVVPGSTLEGLVLCRTRVLSGGRFRALLRCVRTDAGAGGRKTVLYEQTTGIAGDLAEGLPDGSVVPLLLDIPEDAPPATSRYRDPAVNWVLRVDAQAEDLTFGAEFDLPVFRVGDASLIERRLESAGAVGA